MENYNKNTKLKQLNEQNLKNIFGNNFNEKLSIQNKIHLFDRKIKSMKKKKKLI